MAHTNRLNFTDYAFWCFALSVALLPIGLGGNRPIPMGLAQAGLAASCLLLLSSPGVWSQVHFFPRIRWALGLFGVVLLWAFFQTMPFVPGSWVHPLWHEAATVLGTSIHGAIAVTPEDSLQGITGLMTYIAAGLLGYILGQDAGRAQSLIKTLWLSGTVICAYGLLVYITGMDKILWFDKWAYQGDLTATFVNRNHFALYAGMVLVCGASLFFRSWQQKVQRQKPHKRIALLREWLVKEGFFQVFLLFMVFLCIIFSHSRAGLLLAVFGVGAYFFFYQIYLKAWKRMVIMGLVALGLLIVASVIAMQLSERFSVLFNDSSSLDRLKVYKMVWRALLDNPWLGYGLNGFEAEYRLYQHNMLMGFKRAHSDVLESLLDLGVPFGLLLWVAIGLLLSVLGHGVMRRRQNGIFSVLALTTSCMVLLHACVDFSLQIPGVAMVWAALLGTGLAQSWTQSDRQTIANTKG
ncbi:MAG: O-antigen ligase family protein [Alphaproteobacteria bacterium]|nr:O-antigen ligase family protein [Alphaproteobacteria bacterium]